MNESALDILRSPDSGQPLVVDSEGRLADAAGHVYPIVNGIPRFVGSDNYAASFGLQWTLFAKTQIDKFNGTTISRDRFYESVPWRPDELKGQRVLEVGSGAGRFTQILLDAGCEVHSVDYSNAVDVNLANNGPHPKLHMYQASMYELPFAPAVFDRVVSFGVLQHTPDVKRAFLRMVPFLKCGGEIAVDVYSRTFKEHMLNSKYWYRPLTRRVSKDRLLKAVRWIVPRWLPVSSLFRRIPKVGYYLSNMLPVPNYARCFPSLTKDQLVEWSILDMFDMLSPEYDQPQTLETLRSWLVEAGLQEVQCKRGGNGFVGVGKRPALQVSWAPIGTTDEQA